MYMSANVPLLMRLLMNMQWLAGVNMSSLTENAQSLSENLEFLKFRYKTWLSRTLLPLGSENPPALGHC